MTKISLKEKIIPAFYDSWKAFKNNKYLHYVFKGGRASSKSTTIAIRLIMNRMSTNTHALVVRRWQKVLRTTVRQQIIWAIHHLDVQDAWEWSDKLTADMTITYKPTGAKIFFEGADSDKIKGWKTFDMPTTDIWFEEITDFKTDYELTSIVLSILRAILPDGFSYSFFYSYNPPRRRSSWVNKKYESKLQPDNVYVHHSDYRDNPFLPKEFDDEAEEAKKKNKHRYDWEFLGLPIGDGIIPFSNLTFRTITDEEIKSFDNLRFGNDWGYAVDPNAYVIWHYDKTRKRIYAVNEIYGVKMSNEELSNKIKKLGYQKQLTIADSAEPKSIAQLKVLGCNFKGAKKGQGSVETGEKWLDELEEIIIDTERTPNIAREFDGAEYDVDRDGNTISRLKDIDNHTIDSTRYAFENDMVKLDKWGW